MTKKEKVYKQILDEFESKLTRYDLFWGIHKLEYTRLDVGMDQNEVLPDEMIFEEGYIPNLLRSLFIFFFLFVAYLINRDDIFMLLFSCVLITLIGIMMILIRIASIEKIIISKNGIKLGSKKEILWENILDTYLKVTTNGRNKNEYFIISLQDETCIEQEISMYWGSKYCNIAHYTEMYKKKYYYKKN